MRVSEKLILGPARAFDRAMDRAIDWVALYSFVFVIHFMFG